MTDVEIVRRLERLERDNRRLKRVAVVALALVAACVGLGAAYGKPAVPQKIMAHEFDVVDGSGRVRIQMGALGTGDAGAGINIFDAKGKKREALQVSYGLPSIRLLDRNENTDVSIRGGPMFQASPLAWGPKSLESEIDMYGGGGAYVLTSISLGVSTSGAPNITLDGGGTQGSRLELGSTALEGERTGTTEQTSAASVVMFGNDKEHHVIWQAPQ